MKNRAVQHICTARVLPVMLDVYLLFNELYVSVVPILLHRYKIDTR